MSLNEFAHVNKRVFKLIKAKYAAQDPKIDFKEFYINLSWGGATITIKL